MTGALDLPCVLLAGVPIDAVTNESVLDVIDALVADGRRAKRSHQVATVNLDFLVKASEDPLLRLLLQRTSLNIADGMPLVWGSRAVGEPLGERVAGSDLVSRLAAESEGRGWRIHLFGGPPGAADRARQTMLERHPGASVSADSGPMIPDPTDVDGATLESIASVDADIVCVALGNPKQERFVAAHLDRLESPVLIGVGGSLEMMLGDRRRAPEWVQRIGMEWVVRAAQEPSRLGRRYAHDLRVVGPLAWAERSRRARGRSGPSLGYRIDGRRLVIGPDRGPQPDWNEPVAGTESIDDLEIDLRGIDELTSSAVTMLVRALRTAERTSWSVVVSGVGPGARRAFERDQVVGLFAPHLDDEESGGHDT